MPTGIDTDDENPLPVMFAGQLVIVYAMGSVTPSLPIVSLFACPDEQATACTAFMVHFTDGDVPLAVVLGVKVPEPDRSMVKDIEPAAAEVHESLTVTLTLFIGNVAVIGDPGPPHVTVIVIVEPFE